jgi:putative Holliday junction resolvase
MPIYNDIHEFAAVLPAAGRVLAMDLGTKTLGLAVSDAGRMIANPLEVFQLTKFTPDAQKLAQLITREKIVGLVLGLPMALDGSIGPRAQASYQFAENLHNLGEPFTTLPLLLWDERFTTAAVQRMLTDEADMRRDARAATVDKLAAAYMLKRVLDTIRY